MSTKFHQQLRQEAEQWRQDGWIDAELYQRLSDRYQFAAVEPAANGRFVAILLSLGGVLLGLGVITFVAANWQVWPRSLRVALLMGLFIAVNAGGFYLWRRPAQQPGLQRLGHGLLLTGGLVLGANMALMSQMFHQSGEAYELYFVWGLGVALMAYSLRLVSLGVMAWGLLALSYGNWWVTDLFSSQVGWVAAGMGLMATLMVVLFVPLAYRCRSRVLFTLAGLGFAVSFTTGLLPVATHWLGLLPVALLLPPALLWAYSPSIWRLTPQVNPLAVDRFQPMARSLTVWHLAGVLYVFSFNEPWLGLRGMMNDSFSGMGWAVELLLFASLTGVGWLQLRHSLSLRAIQPERSVNTGAIAVTLLLSAGLFFWHLFASDITIVATFFFNVMLFLLAIALFKDGLTLGTRRTFWGGMTLLILGLLTRLFEYNLDLMLKAAVLVLCGVSVIAAGLWFERHLRPGDGVQS
ncbi:MAG: DUF2157 domain-containing protein [Cyanobacteria bacterium P01_A01_bin.105]